MNNKLDNIKHTQPPVLKDDRVFGGVPLSTSPNTSKKSGYSQTTVRTRSPTQTRREQTLLLTRKTPSVLSCCPLWQQPTGDNKISTLAHCLSPRASPEWNRVQPLPRRLSPEPKLCIELCMTISRRYLSTSRTTSGSVSTREVMFHVPVPTMHHTLYPTPTMPPVGGGPTGGPHISGKEKPLDFFKFSFRAP